MSNPFTQYDSEENRKQYEAEQKQRAMERRIRKTKREVMGYREAMENAQTEETKAAFEAKYQKKAALLQEQNKAYNQYCEETGLKKLHDRITIAKWDRSQAAKATAAARKYRSSLDGGQSYKPVTRGESATFSPKSGETVSVKSISGYENVYISDNATIKPKALHDINKNTVNAMKEWGVSSNIKPKTVILSNDEMPTAYGRYSAVTNTVYYTPDIANKEIMESNGGLGAVEYHEMWHLKQASDFRSKGWVITENNYRNYMGALVAQCKINVDKLGITEYNVGEISQYAKKMYFVGRYDEVEAEYMVKKMRGK